MSNSNYILSMASEYEQQGNLLAQKVEQKRKLLSSGYLLTPKERIYTEKSLSILEEMLDDCTATMWDLRRMAAEKNE